MHEIKLGTRPLTIEDVGAIARAEAKVSPSDPAFRERIEKGAKLLTALLDNGEHVYGVTTGYGDSCTETVARQLVEQLPANLARYHGCGMGDLFSEEETRAIQMSRIASLTHGASGVRTEMIDFLSDQLNRGITPRIPQEGSVGASGDLTPLSYLASTCLAEGEVTYQGRVYATADLYHELGIQAPGLRPKEGLAIMNGTAVMTALACLAFERASYLCRLASKITGANLVALMGNASHFDEFLFTAKPHPGQMQAAAWIRGELSPAFIAGKSSRLQDRYSIRCAPHIIGVLQDALNMFRPVIETELNSANDNPLVDVRGERVVHGGNFYGGHIAFVMDSLKVLIANVADLLDRQLALIVDPKFNNGLPTGLSGVRSDKSLHHGFKAVQIGASAWTAEALKQSLPASIFSRSTECHNQDKVSMGTIAARDCMRSLRLTEQVAGACAFASAQALELRRLSGEISDDVLGESLKRFKEQVFEAAAFVEEDRRLDKDLTRLCTQIEERRWELD